MNKTKRRKKYLEITIKDPRLQKIRRNLRLILQAAYNAKYQKLSEEIEKHRKIDKREVYFKRYDKFRDLGYSYNRSILKCGMCKTIKGDRIFVFIGNKWYCFKCYENHLPKSFLKNWQPFYPFKKEGILEFYNRLQNWFKSGRPHAEGYFGDTRQILTEMGASKKDQNRFLATLKEYGGFNDGEILMNTWPYVRDDFNLNKKIYFDIF